MIIAVKNPTNEPRSGFVNIPWSTISNQDLDPGQSVIVKFSGNGGRVWHTQLDKIAIDPKNDDRSLWELTVYMDYMEPGGYYTANPVNLDVQIASQSWPPRGTDPLPRVDTWNQSNSAALAGERLFAELRLPAGSFFGGAFTSIQLHGREILDAFGAERHPVRDHDPDKRLQLDRVSLPNNARLSDPATVVKLFDRDWRLVSRGDGPARAWVLIESPIIHYPTPEKPVLNAHLYRLISLYHDADYLIEDVFVMGAPPRKKAVNRLISFAPHFFLRMDFDPFPTMLVTRVPNIPDWFCIGTHRDPKQAYGFAATVHAGRVDNPPLDYLAKKKHAAFGWELGFSHSRVRCVHYFQRAIDAHQAAHETGRKWFDLIFKPPHL